MPNPLTCALSGALFIHRPDLTTLVVSGPDARSWLNGMLTCDLAKVSSQEAVYGLLLNKKGKIMADVIAVAEPQRLLLAVPASRAPMLGDELDRHLIMEDAELKLEPSLAWAVGYGPLAADVLVRASGDELVHQAPASLAGLVGAVLVADAQPLAARLGRMVALDPAHVTLSDLPTFDKVRFELGVPRFGQDFDDSCYPQEVGLDERAISFTKGCYLGQEVVVKMRSRGHPARQLKRLVLHEPHAHVRAGDSICTSEGTVIGTVTSVTTSSSRGVPLAFGMMRFAEANRNQQVRVAESGATVHEAWGPLQ